MTIMWPTDFYLSQMVVFVLHILTLPEQLMTQEWLQWAKSTIDWSCLWYDVEKAKVVVDSAFASEARDLFIKSYQTYQGRSGHLRQDGRVDNEATAMRKIAEWWMRALQGLFPWLKEKILFEERGDRKIRLNLMVLLYNFQVSKVGQNQIGSVYMPYLIKLYLTALGKICKEVIQTV